MYNPLALTDKRILVTGASSGIGQATARTLARLGARVILSGRREDALNETRDAMERPDDHVVAAFDLADTDGITPWLKELTASRQAPLDGVVHAAGVAGITPLRMVRREHMDQVFSPNLFAAMGLLRAMATRGIGAEGASVVLMSSSAAIVGPASMGIYAGSKAALQALARSAAKELGGKRIRVNCVAPGYVDTPMLQQAREGFPGDAFQKTVEQHFLGLLTPEEVAEASAFLLSDAARRITGQTLVVDGGYSL